MGERLCAAITRARLDRRSNVIEYSIRWADGRNERVAEIAAEFVRLKVAVIVTYANTAAAGNKAGGSDHSDRICGGQETLFGMALSIFRPLGANITGSLIQQTDLAGKRLEILRDLLPNLRTLAILANQADPMPGWKWTRGCRQRRDALASLSFDRHAENRGLSTGARRHLKAARKQFFNLQRYRCG